MTPLVAWKGVGYAALSVAMGAYFWHLAYEIRRGERVSGICGQVLSTLAVISWGLWLLERAQKGHGWPFVSAADLAIGVSFLMLLLYSVLSPFDRRAPAAGFPVTAIALILASYGLGQSQAVALATPVTSRGELVRDALNLSGASLLALAAAVDLGGRLYVHLQAQEHESNSTPSVPMVQAGLFCLAIGLAIDTWWLQKIGLGSTDDAQQAGIAIVWVAYFAALRLRTSRRWRGWPWTIALLIGLACILPALFNVPWLERVLGV